MIVYLTKIPTEITEILLEEDEIVPQDSVPEDKQDWLDILNDMVISGKLLIFFENNVVILLRRYNAYIGIFDTKVGSKASAKEVIKAYKKFFSWAKEGTYYYKLETRTPLEKYGRVMARATGATLEGTRKKSYMNKENQMVDEYEYGYVIDRSNVCQ